MENGFGVGSAFIFQAVVMLVFNTMLLKGNSENGTFSVAVFGVIYTMSTIPGLCLTVLELRHPRLSPF